MHRMAQGDQSEALCRQLGDVLARHHGIVEDRFIDTVICQSPPQDRQKPGRGVDPDTTSPPERSACQCVLVSGWRSRWLAGAPPPNRAD